MSRKMNRLYKFFNRLSQSQALKDSSGILETKFFETLYRLAYMSGLSTYERSIQYKIYSYTVQLMTLLLMCGEIWFMFTEASTLDQITKSFSVFGLQCISRLKFWNVVSNKALYYKLARSMESSYFDIVTESRQKIVNTWAQKSKTNLKLFCFIAICSLVSWFLDPLLDDVEYNLATDTSLPFNFKTPYLYPLAYLLVMVALWYAGAYVVITGATMQAHLVHLLCQFRILVDCFENLLEDCSKDFPGISENDLIHNKDFAEIITQRLANLVKQHQLILSLTRDLKAVVSVPMLAQLAVTGSVICVAGYQGATTFDQGIVKASMSIIFLVYNIFELYIVCRWCEEITTLSSKLGEAIYCSGWERGVSQVRGVRSTILIVMARADKPLYFTAGGMYDLTVDSFARLMKGSYSVLTMMLGSRSE